MASGPLVGGSGDGSSRKKHRWAESKVYTRKIHNKNPKNPPQAPSSQTLAQEDTNTSSQHQNSTTRLDVASDDSSNHRQVDQVNRVDVINNHDEVPNENASVSRSDNHLTINLSSSSKQEVRELKKKLVNELEQVRSLLKKLEAEELEVSGVNGYTYSQFLGSDVVENGGLRRMDSVVEENGGVRRLDCEVEENGELRRMDYEVEENGGLRRMDCEAEEIGELRRLDCEVEENGGLRRMDCEVENGGFRRLNSEIEENGVFRRMNSEVEENVELRRMNPEVENGGFRRANFEVGNDGFRRSNSEVGNSGLRRMNSEVEKGGLRRMNSEAVSVCNRGPPRSLQVSVMENGYRHGYGQGGVSGVVEKRTPKVNQYYKNSGFIVGKEKFPPPESNKKSKGSKNHGFGLGIQYSKVFKNCNSLLTKLMKHRYGWVFNKPVDVNGLGLHDYYLIIKHPMDLGTVKSRLNTNWYRSPRDFAEDVRLTFNNAMTYNPKGQDVHIMAEVLSKMFEDDWADMENEYDLDSWFEVEHEVILPMPMARKVPPPPPTVHQEIRRIERLDSLSQTVDCKPKPVNSAPQGRIPALKKPKAKDLNKRDMTFEEKQKLSENLQKLPSEKLDSIVHIIKKRNTSLSQNDDEIEVDIDLVDIETLWELDRFVTNYKKSLSKYKRRAELAQAREAAARYAREMNPTPVQTVVPLETKTDERNVLPSSPMQVERQGDPSSRSSSSSSSSSDSGSSSSDSDSDSSSDSDAGNSPRT